MSIELVSVESEYERKTNLKKEDVASIREWMSKQAHLPNVTDLQIALFLNSCYFKLEATKVCIENFYTLRNLCPELFSNRDIFSNSVQQAIRTVSTTPLPKLTPQKHMCLMIKLVDANPDVFIINDILKRIDIQINVLGLHKGLQDGHVIIFDSAGLQLGHIFKLNLISLKKFLHYVQEAMPIRLTEIHVLNVSSITEKFINMVKPFLKKELVDMLRTHTNMESFYKFVPKELMPSDYGGQMKTFEELHLQSVKDVADNRDFILEDEMKKTDESMRQGKRTDYNRIFGVEGTFKKLELD